MFCIRTASLGKELEPAKKRLLSCKGKKIVLSGMQERWDFHEQRMHVKNLLQAIEQAERGRFMRLETE
jgi:hypothetical protein